MHIDGDVRNARFGRPYIFFLGYTYNLGAVIDGTITLYHLVPRGESRCEAPPVTDMREPLSCAYFRPLGAGIHDDSSHSLTKIGDHVFHAANCSRRGA